MSVVTDVIVTCDDETDLARLNEVWGRVDFVRVDHLAGGPKAMQITVGVSAQNYFEKERFIECMRLVEWYNPDGVRVFINEEDTDFGFSELEWRMAQ